MRLGVGDALIVIDNFATTRQPSITSFPSTRAGTTPEETCFVAVQTVIAKRVRLTGKVGIRPLITIHTKKKSKLWIG